ncbi:MAG TPA: thiamine pyrophosphate-dependent dehydrogenase E1 component subunit alpha [Fimbriimonadales bacterium]|nr:thiamine pyrophosphate-dependent dehydrogenase E1 component subunit alpha [Fimbriimonadales bacterium]
MNQKSTVIPSEEEVKTEEDKERKAKPILPRNSLTREDHLEILRQIYLARYFDVRLIKEKRRGRLRGTLYSSQNQEAILVGTLYGLRSDDWISPVHRDMPAFFLKDMRSGWDNPERKGMSIAQVCAQVWGKATAPGRAKDNWSHIGSVPLGIIPSTSMLASTIPVACGVAYDFKLRNHDGVVLTYNGEGSTARGDFHEGLNLAAIHDLAVIVVVENNQWAYGTPVELECPTEDVADRARGYNIPGLVADGQDVLDVYDKTMWCVERARKGLGPSIIECKTYRAFGHGDHDDQRADRYRSKEEIERGRRRDPIAVYKTYLVENGILSEEEAKRYSPEGKHAIQVTDEDFPPEVVEAVRKGVEFAIASPLPEPEEAFKHVFVEE